MARTVRRPARLQGSVQVPGDKSISHRAALLGALASGPTTVRRFLAADDCRATLDCLRALGVEWRLTEEAPGVATLELQGVGLRGLREPTNVLDAGNSGTTLRLLAGVLAGQPFASFLTGDASLRSRPVDRIVEPLRLMGAQLFARDGDRRPPLAIHGGPLRGIRYRLPVASAQVKSAVLLAGLHAPGRTTVIEPAPTRDHTERLLAQFGAETCIEDRPDGSRAISVSGDAELTGVPVSVPADPSSAAFAIAAALLTKGSDIVVDCVSMNPTRTGFIETLREMGADIELLDLRQQGGEPVGDLRVRASALKAVDVPPERAPSMIDEYPVLAAIAALAEGETSLRGLSELKVKESDRLAATAEGLIACGVEARVEGDDLIVVGRETVEGGAVVSTHMDHRIAMAFLVLGLAAEKPVTVDDTSMIATSFPEFVPLMTKLGAQFQ